jgi:hypothetical protein
MFENILDLIQSVPAFDDGATFNETIVLMNNINNLEVLRLQNASLGFATESSTQTKVDAVRNNDFIMKIGRSYIKQLSVIFSMKPAQDFYRAAPPDTSGNIYPVAYDY